MVGDTPVVIQAALSGPCRRRTEGFPVPVTDGEVVADALAAWDAGAAVIQLRAWEPDGSPSGRAEHFAPLVDGIRAAGCDAVLEFACGIHYAGGLDCLALRPELALIGWDADGPAAQLDGSLPLLRQGLAALRESGTAAEVRCHDAGQVAALLRLRDEGLADDPLRVQLVVGEGVADPIERVLAMSSLLPDDAIWSVAGIGAEQLRINVLCLLAGGHVRTGLEDNVWLVEGIQATNEELVQRIVRIVDDLDRPLAPPDEAREVLALGRPAWAPRTRRRAALQGTVDLRLVAG